MLLVIIISWTTFNTTDSVGSNTVLSTDTRCHRLPLDVVVILLFLRGRLEYILTVGFIVTVQNSLEKLPPSRGSRHCRLREIMGFFKLERSCWEVAYWRHGENIRRLVVRTSWHTVSHAVTSWPWYIASLASIRGTTVTTTVYIRTPKSWRDGK